MSTIVLSVRATTVRLLTIAVAAILSMGLYLASANAACTAAPRSGCTSSFVPHKSTIKFFQTGRHDPDDIYTWRWNAGSAIALGDFGKPPATGYAFCIYDSSARPQPVVADAPDNPAGWSQIRSGLAYLQRGEGAFRIARLHAGPDGKANIQVHGNSDTVTQLLPFVAPVTVQLQTDDAGCWETDFPTPSRSDATVFRARD